MPTPNTVFSTKKKEEFPISARLNKTGRDVLSRMGFRGAVRIQFFTGVFPYFNTEPNKGMAYIYDKTGNILSDAIGQGVILTEKVADQDILE